MRKLAILDQCFSLGPTPEIAYLRNCSAWLLLLKHLGNMNVGRRMREESHTKSNAPGKLRC